MGSFKNLLKEFFIFFHLDVTKNLKYDRLTRVILKIHLQKNHNCIDIGSHKGEILDFMLKYAPLGIHYAFEPIPLLYESLKNRFLNRAKVYPYALSDENGTTRFQFVKNAPAYSGIKKRRYDIPDPDIEEIEVEVKKLDDVLSGNESIHFVKIDVEGNELAVLKGAKKMLKKDKPLLLFEFGKGAGDYYGTTASDLYSLICTEIGLRIFTLVGFLNGDDPLDQNKFEYMFHANKEYYFVACRESEAGGHKNQQINHSSNQP